MPLIRIVEAIIATAKSWSARPARSSCSLRLVPDGAPEVGAFGSVSVMDVFLGGGLTCPSTAADAAVQPQGATAGETLAMSGKKIRASEWLPDVYMVILR